MTIFYIEMKIRAGGGNFRAGGGNFRAGGGTLGQQGAPPLLFLFMGNTSTGWRSLSSIIGRCTLYTLGSSSSSNKELTPSLAYHRTGA